MAFTLAIIDKQVMGAKRLNVISCSVDSASGNVDTGLKVIDFYSITPISMATTAMSTKKNIGSGATSRGGILNINSAASGDVFYVLAYGR